MKSTKLFIYSAGTVGYCTPMRAQAQRVVANLFADTRTRDLEVIVCLVTGEEPNDELEEALAIYSSCPLVTKVMCLKEAYQSVTENYKIPAQLLIAQMRTAAVMRAISMDVDYCWSLDSDVLPPVNALRCMLDMLKFDDGYYDVAFCPYPSQGGGSFLGGRGDVTSPILPDVYEDEKVVPEKLLDQRKELRNRLDDKDNKPSHNEAAKIIDQLNELEKEIRSLPSEGNVFHNNAKGWRRRGWFDSAYPAIGKGAVVPTDWTGMGCLVMSKKALSCCDWLGYDGRGTEDLFVNYHKWAANELRICVIPHCPCDHVIRHPNNSGQYVHIMAYHEPRGECAGHLRQRALPWYDHRAGEHPSPQNDGNPRPDTTTTEASDPQLQDLAKVE